MNAESVYLFRHDRALRPRPARLRRGPRDAPPGSGPAVRRIPVRHPRRFATIPFQPRACAHTRLVILRDSIRTPGISLLTPDDDLDRKDLAACSRGDQQALRRLWDRHAGRVQGLALRMIRRRDWAEDVMQETFVKIWKNASTFRGDAKPGTWIASIALNEARMRLRGESRRPAGALGDAAESVEAPEVPEEDPRLEALRVELARVEPEEREMLLLAAQGIGYDEIGLTMNLSADQVRGRLYRARKVLAGRMKGGDA